MIFLSTLLRQNIYDNENKRVGVVNDVWVSLDETFPVITALEVHTPIRSDNLIISWSQIQSIEELPLLLNAEQSQITTYNPHANELLLKRDILDKQIVDTQGFRVVKVNDLKLAQIKKTARLVGVDISLNGLLRRLGIQPAFNALSRVLPVRLQERTITWNYIEPMQVAKGNTGQLAPVLAGAASATSAAVSFVPQVQLNVSHTKLANLHPADVADILEQLDVEEAGAVLDRLGTEMAADTLNEIEYPRQTELLSELDPERASDLLERLPPDDAANILADMAQHDAERLLNLMPADEAQPIRKIMRYPAETAGRIMTTEVLALSQEATIEAALTYLRQHSSHLEMIYYLYIVDDEQRLQGVVSLRQLVTAEPQVRLRALMNPDVIKVQSGTDQEEVARVIAKYDLLGVPVVDEDNQLLGLVTVDDVIDVIHDEQAEDFSEIAGVDVEEAEEEERLSFRSVLNRSTWLAVNVVAGFILALIISQNFATLFAANGVLVTLAGAMGAQQSQVALSSLLCLMPMLLLTSGSAGSQTLGIAGWNMRMKRGRDFWRGFWRELLVGTTGGILTSILVGVMALILFQSLPLSIVFALSFGFTLLIATICGMLLPNLLQRLRLRGSLISAPLLDPVIAVISLSVFLLLTLTLVASFAL